MRSRSQRLSVNLLLAPGALLGSRYQPGAGGLMHRCFEIDNVVNVFPAMERILAEDGRTFEEMYWSLDWHFNEYGNRVFARVVFQALERRLARSSIGGGGSNPTETDNGGAR